MAGCSACQRRRKLLLAKLAAKKAKGKRVQAAAIGAVIAVTGKVGQTLGIHGEVEDGQERTQSEDPPAS